MGAAMNGDSEVKTAHRLYKQRQWIDAKEHFEKGLEFGLIEHSRPEVLTSIGNCLHMLGQIEESHQYHVRRLPKIHNTTELSQTRARSTARNADTTKPRHFI